MMRKNYGYLSQDELYHYGILGMKWGVRRYQNKDGTLTEAGKKRVNSQMSSKKIYKRLKKAVRNSRGKQHGWSNRFGSITPIGENSKSLIEQDKENRKKYESTKAYKEWQQKLAAVEDKYNDFFNKNGYVDIEEYDKEYQDVYEQKPKPKYNTLSFTKTYTSYGKTYLDNYLNKGGKDLSIAYLKDLGYNQKQAEALVDRMLKKNYTLGDI